MAKNALQFALVSSIFLTSIISCKNSIDDKLADLKKERLSFEKKVATIKNDSLRQKAKQFGGMLFWMQEIELENERPPKDTVYDENPFMILEDYGSAQDLATNYLDGIIVEKDDSRGDKIELKLHYPYALPFAQKTSWTSVKFSDQSLTGIIEDESDSLLKRQVVRTNWNNEEGFDILYPDEKSFLATPISLNGTVEAQVPKGILKFTFKSSEKGDTKEQNGIKVKLAKAEGHAVSIEVINPNKTDPAVNTAKVDPVTILAADETKKFLRQSGSSTGSEEMFAYYKKLLNEIIKDPEKVSTLEKDLDEQERKYEAKHMHTAYYSAYFKGKVDEVVVYVVDYSKVVTLKRNFALPIYSFKAQSSGHIPVFDMPTFATAYDHAVAKQLIMKPELSAGELNSKIKINQSSMTSSSSDREEEKWRIEFNYPEMLSSAFIDNFDRYKGAKEISFFEDKNGKKLAIPKDSIDYNDYQFNGSNPLVQFNTYSVNFNPDRLPGKAKYLKAQIQVRLADIAKTSYPINKLPTGITVSGNRVMVDGSLIKDKLLIFPKNTAGKYLKKITSVDFPKGEHFGPSIKADYYYGKPFMLDCYQLKGEHLAHYNFDVKLTYDEYKKEQKQKQ